MAGETVLIVEDNAVNLELVRDLLEVAGYTIQEATSGEEAINKVNQLQPHLVLMDLQLPGMDGLAVTRKLKGDPATRDVIIVALTAYAMRGDAEKVFEAGCDGYISKPIDTREFPQLIAQFLCPADPMDRTGA